MFFWGFGEYFMRTTLHPRSVVAYNIPLLISKKGERTNWTKLLHIMPYKFKWATWGESKHTCMKNIFTTLFSIAFHIIHNHAKKPIFRCSNIATTRSNLLHTVLPLIALLSPVDQIIIQSPSLFQSIENHVVVLPFTTTQTGIWKRKHIAKFAKQLQLSTTLPTLSEWHAFHMVYILWHILATSSLP